MEHGYPRASIKSALSGLAWKLQNGACSTGPSIVPDPGTESKMNPTKRILLASLLFLCTAAGLLAQTATISGTIADPSGSGIPDAKVTVRNTATAAVRVASTDQSGFYSVPNLLVGVYEITVDQRGFQTLRFQNVTLTVAQNLTLNGTLQVGSVSQSVDVAG